MIHIATPNLRAEYQSVWMHSDHIPRSHVIALREAYRELRRGGDAPGVRPVCTPRRLPRRVQCPVLGRPLTKEKAMRHRKFITVPFFRVGQRKPTCDELRRLSGFGPRFGPPAA